MKPISTLATSSAANELTVPIHLKTPNVMIPLNVFQKLKKCNTYAAGLKETTSRQESILVCLFIGERE